MHAAAERSDVEPDRLLVRHAPCGGSRAGVTQGPADRASARFALRLVGASPQVNLRFGEASRPALRRAAAQARDAHRLIQLVARLVGDRGHRPLATAREKRSARTAPYGSENPSGWDLPSSGRIFRAHRRVPRRDRRADGAPRRSRGYGTRWRRIRGAHGCDCVHGAAVRMGGRLGTAASSCSAETSPYRRTPILNCAPSQLGTPPPSEVFKHAASASGLEWRRSRKHTCDRALLLVSPLHAAGAQRLLRVLGEFA